MKDQAIIGLATAAAVVLIGYRLGNSLGGAVSNVGQGLNNTLTGAGNALTFSGQGVYEIGKGTGQGVADIGGGIYQIGAGTGSALNQVGGGIYEIGSGTGYAISGANAQDLLQTLLSGGKEASTYQQTTNQALLKTPTPTLKQETPTDFVQNQTHVIKNQFGTISPVDNTGKILPQSIAPTSSGGGSTLKTSSGGGITGNVVSLASPKVPMSYVPKSTIKKVLKTPNIVPKSPLDFGGGGVFGAIGNIFGGLF